LGEVVLDSSVIVKSLVKPGHWLPRHVLEREEETHVKAKTLIRLLSEKHYTVPIPYPALVEVAAVLTRLVNSSFARKVVESLKSTRNHVTVS